MGYPNNNYVTLLKLCIIIGKNVAGRVLVSGFFWLNVVMMVHCHLPPYIENEVNKIEAACDQARKCIHDTIPICGKSTSGTDMKRTFWDLCDLFEYACDNEEVWRHTPDVDGCPDIS